MNSSLPTIPNGVEEPHAWWRDPCETSVLLRVSDPQCLRELLATVARVAPLARDLAAAIRRGDVAGLVAHAVRRRPADNFATDLLGSALIVEAVAGNPVARMLIDHMRRQRALPPLLWAERNGPAGRQDQQAPQDESPVT